MRTILAFAALLAVLPTEAFGCSIMPAPPPSQAQMDRWTRQSYRRAEALVEVVAEVGSNYDRPGRMRVIRVYKGNIRPGAILSVRSQQSSMCGAGDFARGSRGLMLIGRLRSPIVFEGYRSPAYLANLRRLGFRPVPRDR